MHMSARTIGILLALIFMLAAVILWVLQGTQEAPANSLEDIFKPAAPLVGPVMKEVAADRGWQTTGILVKAGETIRFQFQSGEINDGDTIVRGPAGVGWACSESSCCEPMPLEGRDALICRVGDEFFLIGDKTEVTVSSGGELQLCVNDCDAGLSDNSGSLRLKIFLANEFLKRFLKALFAEPASIFEHAFCLEAMR